MKNNSIKEEYKMKSNVRTLLSLVLVSCIVLFLAACGAKNDAAPAAPEEAGASAAGTSEFKTMGDVLAYDSENSGYSETHYVYVFDKDGVTYRAVAELPADVSEAIWAIDFFDENRDAMILDAVAPLEIMQLDNLTEMIPAQTELDALVGKTGQELKDDGWSIWSWDLDAMEFGMYHGPFAYTVVMEGDFQPNENYDFDEDADFAPLTVKSVSYDGIGDATGDVLDQYFGEGFDEEWDEAFYGESGIDYLALVNKLNPLPEGWEDALETVTIENSVGDEVEVEAKAYAAYELLKADLEENNAIYLELDSARRSIAAQQDIIEYSGGLVQPDRRWWCTATGAMVHGARADGARPPRLSFIP